MKKQVNIYVDFKSIRGLFEQAQKENRNSLFEYEVYELIRLSGGETIPRYLVLEKGERLNSEKLLAIPGEKVVIKAISPFIVHKSIVVDSGSLYDPLALALEERGLPVFRSGDQAVRTLGKYIRGRLHAGEIVRAFPASCRT